MDTTEKRERMIRLLPFATLPTAIGLLLLDGAAQLVVLAIGFVLAVVVVVLAVQVMQEQRNESS